MTTDTMTLPALSPQYLIAQVERDKAKKALARIRGRLVYMEGQNEQHESEVKEKSRHNLPLLTNAQALQRGNGSGFEIVHYRCKCEDLPGEPECLCNPRRSPFLPSDLEAVEDAISKAEAKVSKAEKTLEDTPSEFDAFANAREADARFCWWPADKYVDPRIRRFRGQPVTPEQMNALGPHGLNRGVQVGGIVEVPS